MNTLPQTPMEVLLGIDDKGMTSARKLYEYLLLAPQHFTRWAKSTIEENAFAVEGEDYLRVTINGETPTGGKIERIDYKLFSHFAKKIAMQANSERGEQARDYYISVEQKSNELVAVFDSLSPTTKALIGIELKQQKMQEMIEAQQSQIKLQANKLQNITESLVERASDEVWRKNINNQINRIASATKRKHNEIRHESYQLLEEHGRCNLETRLKYRRARLLDEGASRTRIQSTNKLDCIEDEPRLKEIYTSIVQRMALKYTA